MAIINHAQLYPRLYPVLGFIVRGKLLDWWIHKHYRAFNVVAKMYYPENPRTGFQQSMRVIYYDAVKNWQGFDGATKNFYNQLIRPEHMLGYNRYLKLYLNANKNMIIYWGSLAKGATDSASPDVYMSSDRFQGVQKLLSMTSYPAGWPYGAAFYHDTLDKILGLTKTGWKEL